MRKRRNVEISTEYKIMVIDDEEGIIDSVTSLMRRNGYWSRGFVDPVAGLEELQREHYDLLVLDFFMQPMHGDQVVAEIRKTNRELYILLLTGHKDLAPPIDTIKSLDIQAYCEKSDRLDQLQLLIESGIKSISQMRTIQKFRDGLNSILGAVPKIYQLQPIGNILEEILRQILPLVNSSDAFILADDMPSMGSGGKQRTIFRGIGRYDVTVDAFTSMLDPQFMEDIGVARTNAQVIRVEDGVIFPLVNEARATLGVLFVSGAEEEEGVKLLEIYAAQAASSINNAFLHSLVNMKNEELNQTYAQLRTRYMDTIEALRLAVDAKDEYTRGHSDRVSFYAVEIGKKLGMPKEELEKLRIAGVFHDIGKIGTADDILLKNNSLNDREYGEVKKHPITGAMILSAVSMFHDMVPLVRHHHERIDGRGYPDHIKGEEIEQGARIIAVADAFDAMTSDRQYRSHLSLEAAVDQLQGGAGTQFDAEIVRVFIAMLRERPNLPDCVKVPK